jgi:hypothetical protein
VTPKLLRPDDPRAPKFWMYETSGVLKPVVQAYIRGEELTPADVANMRAYLRQWIMAPVWSDIPELQELRSTVDQLATRKDIRDWIWRAVAEGMDPL